MTGHRPPRLPLRSNCDKNGRQILAMHPNKRKVKRKIRKIVNFRIYLLHLKSSTALRAGIHMNEFVSGYV